MAIIVLTFLGSLLGTGTGLALGWGWWTLAGYFGGGWLALALGAWLNYRASSTPCPANRSPIPTPRITRA